MKNMFWIFLSLYSSIAYTQNISGDAIYKYVYNFPNSSKDTLKSFLYFNDLGDSYYSSPNKITFTQNTTYKPDGKVSSDIKNDSIVVYTNIFSKELYYNKQFIKNKLWVADTLKEIKWELLPTSENKKIGRFNCLAAKGKFAGRFYTVWYTPDIPVSTGPWKLYGLPGLILEVMEDTGYIYFTLESLEIAPSSSKKDLIIDKIKSLSITKKEFNKKEKDFLERVKGQSESMGVTLKVTSSKGLELEEHK